MSDLVSRLSVLAEDDGDRYPAHVKKLAEAAASRITALRARVAELEAALRKARISVVTWSPEPTEALETIDAALKEKEPGNAG